MAPVSSPKPPVRIMWSATQMSLTGSSALRTLRYASLHDKKSSWPHGVYLYTFWSNAIPLISSRPLFCSKIAAGQTVVTESHCVSLASSSAFCQLPSVLVVLLFSFWCCTFLSYLSCFSGQSMCLCMADQTCDDSQSTLYMKLYKLHDILTQIARHSHTHNLTVKQQLVFA